MKKLTLLYFCLALFIKATAADTQAPVITGTITLTTIQGCSQFVAPAPVNTVVALEALGVNISDDISLDANLIVTSTDLVLSTCPVSIQRTYTVKDEALNQATTVQIINVVDNITPIYIDTLESFTDTICKWNELRAPVTTISELESYGISISDNCTPNDLLLVQSYDVIDTTHCKVYRTYTVRDACNNATVLPVQVIFLARDTATIAKQLEVGHSEISWTTPVGALDRTITIDGAKLYLKADTIFKSRTYTPLQLARANFRDSVITVLIDSMKAEKLVAPRLLSPLAIVKYIIDDTITVRIDTCLFYCGEIVIDTMVLCVPDLSVSLQSENIIHSGGCAESYIIRRVFIATDTCGLISLPYVQDITVNENFPPLATAPDKFYMLCTDPEPVPDLGGVMVYDYNDPAPVVAFVEDLHDLGGLESCDLFKRVFSITDNCGNVTYVTQEIEKNDFDIPTWVDAPGSLDYTLNCGDAAGLLSAQSVIPMITDNCSALPYVYENSSYFLQGSCSGTGTYITEYLAMDDCFNLSVPLTKTITVVAPDFTLPPNGSMTVSCPDATDVTPSLPIVTDGCGDIITPGVPVISSKPSCEGTRTYTYPYTDCNGVTKNWEYTYTIERNDFTLPPFQIQVVSCPAETFAFYPPPPVLDACGNTIIPTGPVVSATPACEGITTYTWFYTDCEGNTHPWEFTYIVDYANGLVIPANGFSTVSCSPLAVNPGPPANITDACGRVVTPILVGQDAATPACEGTVVWRYRYTACDGTTADWTHTYTIERPDFIMPANGGSTVSCPNETDVVPVPPSVTDACGNFIMASAPVISAKPSCNGTRTYIYTFSDCEGNTHDWVYTYTVMGINALLPPANENSIISCSAMALQPAPPSDIVDGCGNLVSPVLVGQDAANPACEGIVVWRYRYTTCYGTTADWTHTYTIEHDDFVMPANGSSTVTCPDATDVVPSPPSVVDACGNLITPVGAVVTAKPLGSGIRDYVWDYTDCEGNTHSWIYTYTVNPVSFVMPANGSSTVSCPDETDMIPVPPYLTDVCCNVMLPVGPTVTSKPACNGTRTYTWMYMDCTANAYTWEYIYTVVDNISPMISGTINNQPLVESAGVFSIPDVTALVRTIANDNCATNSSLIITQTPLAGSTYTGNLVINVTVSDLCGNQTSATVGLLEPANAHFNGVVYSTPITCYGTASGSISVASVSGGSGKYDYQLEKHNGTAYVLHVPYGGVYTPSSTIKIFPHIAAGLYQVKVKDENNLISVMDTLVNLVDPDPITFVVNISNASCANPYGSLYVTLSGGATPYSYDLDEAQNWRNIPINKTINNLELGNHVFIFRDANHCESAAYNCSIIQTAGGIFGYLSKIDVTSYDGNDGVILLTGVSGGNSANYEYRLVGTETVSGAEINRPYNAALSNLKAGTYSVYVRNAGQFCETLIGSIAITQPTTDIHSVEITDGWVYDVTDGIMIKNYKDQDVRVLDCNGKLIYYGKMSLDTQFIPVPRKTVYLVQVNGKSVKVLVK